MDIVLVRHAESIWNAENRWQGQLDVPLSERGREQAQRLGARLAGIAFDRRICSDLRRAAATAEAIGGTFEHDRAWREIDLGAWGGLLHEEVRRRFPDEVAAMFAGSDRKLGGGESIPEFEARAHRAFDALLASPRSGQRVLVVTHGGVIRALVMRVLGARGRPLVGVANTAVTHLRVEGGRPRLVAFNCTAHLEPTGAPDDEVVGGGEDAVRRAIELLRLGPEAAGAMCAPRPGTQTRFSRREPPQLRVFASPALAP